MIEKLISFETAVLAHSKIFNEYTEMGFDKQGRLSKPHYGDLFRNSDWDNTITYSAPTISSLRRWLVDNNIHISVYPLTDEKQMYGWRINVYEIFPHKQIYRDNSNKYQPFENYDDAVEAGIVEALKSLK